MSSVVADGSCLWNLGELLGTAHASRSTPSPIPSHRGSSEYHDELLDLADEVTLNVCS